MLKLRVFKEEHSIKRECRVMNIRRISQSLNLGYDIIECIQLNLLSATGVLLPQVYTGVVSTSNLVTSDTWSFIFTSFSLSPQFLLLFAPVPVREYLSSGLYLGKFSLILRTFPNLELSKSSK